MARWRGVIPAAMIGALLSIAAAPPPSLAEAAVPADLPVVTLARAEHQNIEARVPISGSLVPRQQVQVHANVAGYEIVAIEAETGDTVKAGQVLARLADEALSAQLSQAEAEYRRAEAGVRQAQSQIDSSAASLTEAAAALERTRSLRRSGNASQALLDQAIAAEAAARAGAASAQDGLRVAQAALAQAEAARRIARLNLGYANITAPVDGVVMARNAQLGAISGTGGQPLFTLIAGGEIELEAEVIETALAGIAVGDPVEVEVAGLGSIDGKVRLVPAAVDPATRLGLARISLAPDPRLRSGVFASGWIVTDRRQALTVPASAVLADDAGERVQVVEQGRVRTRPVQAGLIWQDRREIVSGLAADDMVIARAGAFFRDGDPVRAAP
ncbi:MULTISPECIES: efflux RND transporter periplasmic adaptor subunit [unclassified Paracoccus (in: a-proteobacteria)]|uniref:efflux RND transporter periplasmic adaptor subunit n=1 Tax=unclassified Paracoccus (in: a-proteobacteria) TaxID=2688777 RepID=UPI0012B289D9|nr:MULTISPECIES: efflux RND transporter periplasmic adaptor subunit [unclassified Paracoccus (in: a-proteobacteria)]UXU73906.1 efflux RND transporter periplasmic adaptor subunit [Paracoccus sp. SMMA_5]UXU79794.1 efflux RND transporter periplasmic adaptor subunit [Paracoccus sp. SMMA_5_TC]